MEQIKNSKGEVLSQPYLDLARMRREQQNQSDYFRLFHYDFEETKLLTYAFDSKETPEGSNFWVYVKEGRTPEIPAASLAELEEWRSDKLSQAASDAWIGKQQEPAEPDWKAMYECAITELKNIRALIGADENESTYDEVERKFIQLSREAVEQSTDRNWVAECAMAAMQGFLASYAGATTDPKVEPVAQKSWDYAEAWAEEGKKRNHL